MFKYIVLISIVFCVILICCVIEDCFKIKYYDNYINKKLKI